MAVFRFDRSQTGAIAARTLLALFVIFGLVVFFLPTEPLGSNQAQAQASPSNTTGARIQFLNPSGATANGTGSGPGREVSTMQDADSSYHLVAWVANAPANPIVEFKWSPVDDDINETTIGTGTQRGNDTWDIFWNSVPATDGEYEVTAILYSSGGPEVARDEEPIVVNNQDDPKDNPAEIQQSEDRGETVEITYPAQASIWGAFRQPGTSGSYIGVVDVDASDTSENVRAFYTTTAPGNEPTWVRCSTTAGETFAQSADGVRCTLAEGVSPNSVTAIAAASGDADQTAADGTCFPDGPGVPDENCGEGEDSGDAHRTTGYVQVPGTMTVTPSSQTVSDADGPTAGNQFPCSAAISGTLTDQFGRKVAGANADVHAAGPTDNLHFDDPDTTGSHQAPDGANHTTEPSVSCEGDPPPAPPGTNTSSGQGQGEHEVAGEGDIKHIETAASGTNDAGAILFKLANLSTSITGTTQITAFYDRDNDDRFCSGEVNGNATIGWGTAPAGATGVPSETATCPEPSPTGSSTASASPSGSATGSPTGSPSASQTPGTSRTITLTASRGKVLFSRPVTFSGQIFSSDSTCRDGEFVRIQRRVHGTNSFTNFASATTDADGSFERTVNLRNSADYQAVVAAHDNCQASQSDPATVLVKVKVTRTASDFRPESGETVRFLGKVVPNHKGTKVVLQRKKGGRWVKVAVDTLNKRSRYRFDRRATWPVKRVFRIKWKSQDAEHETNFSRPMRIIIS